MHTTQAERRCHSIPFHASSSWNMMVIVAYIPNGNGNVISNFPRIMNEDEFSYISCRYFFFHRLKYKKLDRFYLVVSSNYCKSEDLWTMEVFAFSCIIHSNTVNNLPLSTTWLLTYNFNLYQQLCLQALFQPESKRLSFNFSFTNNRFYSFTYLSDRNTLCSQTNWSIVCGCYIVSYRRINFIFICS